MISLHISIFMCNHIITVGDGGGGGGEWDGGGGGGGEWNGGQMD